MIFIKSKEERDKDIAKLRERSKRVQASFDATITGFTVVMHEIDSLITEQDEAHAKQEKEIS